MENSIYIGLSRQSASMQNMSIIANNVANANTPGFRAQNTVFEEFISDPRGNDDELSFVYDYGQYDSTSPGPVEETGNSLDVALNGPGFFSIQAPDGTPAYSRAGNFQMDAEGILLSSTGFNVISAGGGDVTIPDDSEFVTIDETGRLSNQDGEFDQLRIVEFEDLQTLEAIGNNLYRTDALEVPATNTTAQQGYLEGSNVNAVTEITRMIETLRGSQSLGRFLESENERIRGTIQQLAGLNS